MIKHEHMTIRQVIRLSRKYIERYWCLVCQKVVSIRIYQEFSDGWKEVKTVGEEPICWRCCRPALEHCYSDEGRKEVEISGLCEECFDELFLKDEDEADD